MKNKKLRRTKIEKRECARQEGEGYSPLPSQKKFHDSKAKFKGFSGPVGSGKSAALCYEAILQAERSPGCTGLLAAPTYAMLRDTTEPMLLSLLEDLDLDYEHKKTEAKIVLTKSGSQILLRSLDNPERLRGTNLAWFGLDELSYTKEESWLRMVARLRDPAAYELCGFGVWTPKGNDWVHRRFISEAKSGSLCVRAEPFENRYVLENAPDYYENLKEAYDPKFYQQEVLGDYIDIFADQVYHCFNRAVHVVPQHYDPTATLMWSLDFNVTPMSSLLVQEREGRLRVIKEIVMQRASTEQVCTEFLNRYGTHRGPLEVFGDASGNKQQTAGGSDYSIVTKRLTQAGLGAFKKRVPPANPPVLRRVAQVNAVLTNAEGLVRLEIDPECPELIQDLAELSYKQGTSVIDKERDPRRSHTSDALGYLICMLDEQPKFGERDRPLW
jgi:Terminase large subunit, T4likevirus-type, N-terminal